MKQWGLSIISVGCIFIMLSQLQETPHLLVVAGLSFVIIGIVMFRKGKKSN